MNNKVIVMLNVPQVDKKYELYLPINRKIGNIINLIGDVIKRDLQDNVTFSHSRLYNSDTKELYGENILLYDTNIRNGSSLILIFE